MTVRKTDEDLKPSTVRSGPEIKGEDIDQSVVDALVKRWPKAKEIEKLASGNYAVRFHKKPTVYKRRAKR